MSGFASLRGGLRSASTLQSCPSSLSKLILSSVLSPSLRAGREGWQASRFSISTPSCRCQFNPTSRQLRLFSSSICNQDARNKENAREPPQNATTEEIDSTARSTSTSKLQSQSPSTVVSDPRPSTQLKGTIQDRHWSNTEPLHPDQLVNPNGRIYSVRHPPEQDQDQFSSSIFFTPRNPSIFRAFLFFSFICLSSYSIATYYVIEDSDRLAEEIQSNSFSSFGSLTSFFGGVESTGAASVGERKLRIAKKQEDAERLGHRMEWITGWCDQLGLSPKVKEFVGTVYLGLAQRYLELAPAQQAIVPIVALNALVFLAWQIPGRTALRFMSRNFLHSPASGRHYPMLTSVFSHYSLAHFLFNNIAAYSFGAMALVSPLFLAHFQPDRGTVGGSSNPNPEASITPHFLALFVTAGVFASLVSHTVMALRFRRVSLLQGLEVAKRTVGKHSGLGASGAIYSVIVMHALAVPDSRLSLIFLPFFSFPIGAGVGAMVAFDMLGIIRGWKMFDHWCHLGGATFGLIYFSMGKPWWERCKELGRQFKEERSK